MRINEVTVQIVDLGQDFLWAGRRPMEIIAALLTVRTDSGVEGHAVAWTTDLPVRAVVSAIDVAVKPCLIGADPLDRPKIIEPLWRGFRIGLPLAVIGMVDVALWDLAGKVAGLPIAQLLGRHRDRVKACASAPPCETSKDCESLVTEIVEQGFRAVKLHVIGDLDTDIATCRAARRAVGDDVELMMDATGVYDRPMALALGRVLDELGFRWFEDPLRDDDFEGWSLLRRQIITPLAGVDSVRFTSRDYAQALARGAYDIVRMDASRQGITQIAQLASLADAFGLKCEGHAFGPALGQAANLQVALAISNGDFCELPVPLGRLDIGVVQGHKLDNEGYVLAPEGPGLGLEIDKEAMAAAVIA